MLKLLAEAKLFSADEKLNSTKSYVNVKSAFRQDIDLLNGLEKALEYKAQKTNIHIMESSTGKQLLSISKEQISEISKQLFSAIKTGSGASFAVNEMIQKQLTQLSINRIKQPSTSKGDITLLIHDPLVGLDTCQKFSIKSLVGSNPTLLNSNKTTNIIYEIKNASGTSLPSSLINEVNSINPKTKKYIARLNFLKENGYSLSYKKYEDETFQLNMQLIDSNLPEILAFAIKEKFSHQISKMPDVISNLKKKNPMQYNQQQGHNFYDYRIVNFLVEAALGMTSKSVWTGIYDATGGIIVVKDNSEVLCYHLIDFNKFKLFLRNSTIIDSPSGSRHGYGSVYSENNKSYIKLNFQIRS